MARPDYPDADFDQIIQKSGGSFYRYLRRVMRRQAEQRRRALLQHFPALKDLSCGLGGSSEYECLRSLSRLRNRLGRLLAGAQEREDCSETGPALETPLAGPGPTMAAPPEKSAQVLKQPRRCTREAWKQFERAALHLGEGCTDDQAYDWLVKEDEQTDGLPARETWKRYLREMRRLLHHQKYTSRRGRTAEGVVRASEIEPQMPTGRRASGGGRDHLLDRLAELAGDVPLGESPADKLWKAIRTTLARLDVPQETIDGLVKDRDPTHILNWVNQARSD
jgi:hypothetical protein